MLQKAFMRCCNDQVSLCPMSLTDNYLGTHLRFFGIMYSLLMKPITALNQSRILSIVSNEMALHART